MASSAPRYDIPLENPCIHVIDAKYSSIPVVGVVFFPKIIFQYRPPERPINVPPYLFEVHDLAYFNRRFNFDLKISINWITLAPNLSIESNGEHTSVDSQICTSTCCIPEGYYPKIEDLGKRLGMIVSISHRQSKIANLVGFRQRFGVVERPTTKENCFPRIWNDHPKYAKTKNVHRLRVVSYNCLTDNYANISSQPMCTSWAIARNYRRPKQSIELLNLTPHLIFLQELHNHDYHSTIGTALRENQYEGEFTSKLNGNRQTALDYGSAIFYKTSVLRLIHRHNINMLEEEKKHENFNSRRNLSRGELIILELELIPNKSSLIVINLHLPSNRMHESNRLRGILIMIHTLRRMFRERKLSKNIPIVLVGDMNSAPTSEIIQALLNGRVTNEYLERQENSGIDFSKLPKVFQDLAFRPAYLDGSARGVGVSHSVLSPHRCLLADYIFYRGNTIRPFSILSPVLDTKADAITDMKKSESENLLTIPNKFFSSDHFIIGVSFQVLQNVQGKDKKRKGVPKVLPIHSRVPIGLNQEICSNIQAMREISATFSRAFRTADDGKTTIHLILNSIHSQHRWLTYCPNFLTQLSQMLINHMLSRLHFEYGFAIVHSENNVEAIGVILNRATRNLCNHLRFFFYRKNHELLSMTNDQLRVTNSVLRVLFKETVSPMILDDFNLRNDKEPKQREKFRTELRKDMLTILHFLFQDLEVRAKNEPSKRGKATCHRHFSEVETHSSASLNFIFPSFPSTTNVNVWKEATHTGEEHEQIWKPISDRFDQFFGKIGSGHTFADVILLLRAENQNLVNISEPVVLQCIADNIHEKLKDMFDTFFPDLQSVPGRVWYEYVTWTDKERFNSFKKYRKYWLTNQLRFLFLPNPTQLSNVFERILRLYPCTKKAFYHDIILRDTMETLRMYFCLRLLDPINKSQYRPCFGVGSGGVDEIRDYYSQNFLQTENTRAGHGLMGLSKDIPDDDLDSYGWRNLEEMDDAT